MKRATIILLGGIAIAGFMLSAIVGAEEAKNPKDTAQVKCPVKGGDINKSYFLDVDGKRIYVCCPGCIEVIKKNPQKYVKDLEAKGIVLDKAK